MANFVFPPRAELHLLRTLPTAGELRVLDFLDRNLDGWEIYFQPHLNGLRPDFVLLHPNVGIAVFEVKDWNLDAMPYFVRQEGCFPSLWSTNERGIQFRRRDNPVEKVVRYKREILGLYCPRLGIQVNQSPQIMSVVTAGVIMTECSTARAVHLFHPFLEHFKLLGDKAVYHPVAGEDALARGDLQAVFPSGRWRSSKFMKPDLADDLRAWLREPDHAAEQRVPLPLNDDQQRVATSRTLTGYRRVRGPAGCGKSLALAARASQLAGERKEVLVGSFNITLLHYLRDLAVRYPHPRESVVRGIAWLHFHDWCRRVCQEAGMEVAYGRLFGASDPGQEEDDDERSDLFEERIPEMVGRAIDEAGQDISRYDAILVDEGQDFNLTWWNLLRRVRRDGGEMLLADDTTQDLYNRSHRWTDDGLRGAGFPNASVLSLSGCYRFPPELISYLRQFAEEFLPDTNINLPTEVRGDLFEQPLTLHWLQVQREAAVDACVKAVCDLSAASPAVAWADIILLVSTREEGIRCVQSLEAPPRNIKANHVFAPDHASQKKLKMAFWMGDARLKAATVHSFKGWEARAMVVHISRAATAGDLAAVYVALSRLRRSERGSFLTVVCSAPELETYGRSWPKFNKC